MQRRVGFPRLTAQRRMEGREQAPRLARNSGVGMPADLVRPVPCRSPRRVGTEGAPEGHVSAAERRGGLPCNRLRPVQVAETDSTVTVSATVQLGDEPSDSMFVTEDVEVTLDRQIDDRMLLGYELP